MTTTRHTSPAGALRTRQKMLKKGYELRAYGMEGEGLVLHWISSTLLKYRWFLRAHKDSPTGVPSPRVET